MRRAARTDNNHADIRDGLRKVGYPVTDLSKSGGGVPDLLVQSKAIDPIFVLLEIKSLGGKLTPAEVKFHLKHKRGPLHKVFSFENALLVMERYDKIRFD